MALAVAEKSRLAELRIPADGPVRARLGRWQAQAGWTDADVADEIGYSRASVNLYRIGRYPQAENPANTLAIRAALVAFMDAHPTALERRPPGEVYHTESYKKLRRVFFAALENGWAYCVDGAPGTQKTFLLLALCAELEAREAGKNGNGRRALYVRCRPRMSRKDLLGEILLAAGIAPHGFIGQMVRKVRAHFANRRAVLVIDEGQQLDNYGLETLREFPDEPPYFGLLLAGSHDLRRKCAAMEQLYSRLQRDVELVGLTPEELRTIWAKEVGTLSEQQFKKLEAFCRVRDRRKREDTSGAHYLSARNLFFSIKQAQARAARGGEDGE